MRRGMTAKRLGGRIALCAIGACLVVPAAATAGTAQGPAGLVKPLVGTEVGAPEFGTGGGGGNTFPGATMPFGMLGWSPDTEPALLNRPGGYSYDDHLIRGFSLKHVSGAGCSIYQDVSLLPTTERLRDSPVAPRDSDVKRGYMGTFKHKREKATPGFYRVQLGPEDGGGGRTSVSLTATERAGVGRISFPRGGPRTVLLNAGGSSNGNSEVTVALDPTTREITGSVTSGGFCEQNNTYTLHFVARFDRAFNSFGTWRRQKLSKRSTASADELVAKQGRKPAGGQGEGLNRKGPTAQAGAFVGFRGPDRSVEVRVGISFVSVDNARENLDAEVGDRTLSEVRIAAHEAWNQTLGRVEVSGGKGGDVRRFYTALYHSLLHPSTFSDANGEYMGMDQEVHQANGFVKYSDFSGWDVYRSQIPLLAMLFPDRASDVVQSLIADATESGWLPRWSVANGHTGVSPGDPAAPTIAGAYALGARDFDQQAALQALVKGGSSTGVSPNSNYVQRPGLSEYLKLGYVPHELNTENSKASQASNYNLVWGSAASTLEYALADFAIARYAAGQCDPLAYATFAGRSANWTRLFNPNSTHIQPRLRNGAFVPVEPKSGEGFIEGSSSQYTWFVPHDVEGLVDALGGGQAAVERLDRFFSRNNAGPTKDLAFLGNEPTLGTPYLYAWLGQPHRVQILVRRALLKLYKNDPGGFPGNDDLGTMSAWYAFGALGFYPAIPGTDVLVLGSPLFHRAVLHLPGGDLTIEAPEASRDRPYVQTMRLDGVPFDRSWISYADLAGGAELDFTMAGAPNPGWASDSDDAPPSFPANTPFPDDCQPQDLGP
jgi:predicted alpha-1,2-mannosidase